MPFPTCKFYIPIIVSLTLGGGGPRPFWSACLYYFVLYYLWTLYCTPCYAIFQLLTWFNHIGICQGFDTTQRNVEMFCAESDLELIKWKEALEGKQVSNKHWYLLGYLLGLLGWIIPLVGPTTGPCTIVLCGRAG